MQELIQLYKNNTQASSKEILDLVSRHVEKIKQVKLQNEKEIMFERSFNEARK